MKNIAHRYLGVSDLYRRIPPCDGGNLYLVESGYNDFDFIEPMKAPRKQPFWSLHYVFSGNGILFVGGKRFAVHEKQAFFLPPEIDILYYPDEDNKWKYCWFCFGGNLAESVGNDMGFSVSCPVRDVPYHEKIELALTDLLCEMKAESDNGYKLLSAFFALVGTFTEPKAAKQNDMSSALAYMAARYIKVNCTDPTFSFETLCRVLYTSHSALCRSFRREFGITPSRYLINERMERAARLLTETQERVGGIALECGYGDEIHFMKSFRRQYGVTATEYRRAAKNGVENDGWKY